MKNLEKIGKNRMKYTAEKKTQYFKKYNYINKYTLNVNDIISIIYLYKI